MGLELHAKTYYNNPLVAGGDEHSIVVPDMSGKPNQSAPVTYFGTGWKLSSGSVYNQDSPIGGYLNIQVVLNGCIHPEMHDAQLTLSGSLSYWLKPPSSGMPTVDWTASMTGTRFQITNVTP